MSKPCKSQSQAKSSSSVGSMCPPTARSPSLTTADALTEPNQIPTALSNSVNTAIGATPSNFETSSGLSDTSAGSGRLNSNASEVRTAKSPTSPEIIMNDLRRGSLFGRQSKSQATTGPKSVTNITFSNTTNISTASQLSSIDAKPLDNSKKSEEKSTKTGISRFSSKKMKTGRGPATSELSAASRKASKKHKMPTKMNESSGKSAKSFKKLKKPEVSDFSKKSAKSTKKVKKPEGVDLDFSKKSKKSISKKSEKAPVKNQFGTSGVVKKGDGFGDNKSSASKGPVGNAPASKAVRRNDLSKSRNSRSRSASRNQQQAPVYNFPGAGKCTRNMDSVAPPPDVFVGNAQNSHCVYDVAALPPVQRRAPPPPPPPTSSQKAPKSLFGNAPKKNASIAATSTKSEKSVKPSPAGNKIVIIGATKDGKTTVQMTIDMQIVAGEALGVSKESVALAPKKIIVAGKEYPVDM